MCRQLATAGNDDLTGKAGAIINLDHNIKKIKTLPLNYEQDIYADLRVINPPVYEWHMNGTSGVLVASDNAYTGIKIDAKSKKVYTLTAIRKDSVAGKGGLTARIEESVAYLVFNTYDFEGQKIAESHLKCELPQALIGLICKSKYLLENNLFL